MKKKKFETHQKDALPEPLSSKSGRKLQSRDLRIFVITSGIDRQEMFGGNFLDLPSYWWSNYSMQEDTIHESSLSWHSYQKLKKSMSFVTTSGIWYLSFVITSGICDRSY
ncbi:hypothetical protein CEXT_615201 [Caerostris extrusa]|uniref:Uncharacterized protein n=1 Tax=Caerostris extrusa TaxID=172846 RepID=A0AAV4PN82_CAEEX|nr:hypothetical protein CEXT_615201 [Caerostris extrusa]